ncbi:hypothetical protein C2S52_017903 [Perilla frutescens var. hirtella]|nr:hypothetical protein C2S52_017903 [Perilla frutescens var. hirtella]
MDDCKGKMSRTIRNLMDSASVTLGQENEFSCVLCGSSLSTSFSNILLMVEAVNAKIRKVVKAINPKVGYMGPSTDFNNDHEHLIIDPVLIQSILLCPFQRQEPAIILRAGIFRRKDTDAIFSSV